MCLWLYALIKQNKGLWDWYTPPFVINNTKPCGIDLVEEINIKSIDDNQSYSGEFKHKMQPI